MAEETKPAPTSTNAEPIPTQGITFEFSYAPTLAFARTLERARQHPSSRQFGEDKNLHVRVTYQFDEIDAIQQIKSVSWDLHHKRVFLHGQEIAWTQMAQLTHCYWEHVSRHKRDHCFFDGNFWNVFGCRYALANLSDRINNDWLTFGHLDPDGAWVFDKARIVQRVNANFYSGFRHCPAFDPEFVTLVLELFPDKIDPKYDTRWRYLHDRRGKIIGVAPKTVATAKNLVYELQMKVRQQRGPEKVGATGKLRLPAELLRTPALGTEKKSWLRRLLG